MKQGTAVKVPVLEPEGERLAEELCGGWSEFPDRQVCWEHCRTAVKGKGYCAEAAREIVG